MYRNQHKTITIEYVKEFFKNNGCTLLSNEYKNIKTKLDYICSCGNKTAIVFDSFQRGNRCRLCGNKKSADKQRRSPDEIYQRIKNRNCTLLSEYVDAKTPIEFQCNECGVKFKKNTGSLNKWPGCYHTGPLNRPKGEQAYQWRQDRDRLLEEYIFRQKCYKLLRSALNSLSKAKDSRTHELLGYTYKELQHHIKSFPGWDKLKNTSWHIDHIFPIKAFVDYGISDLRLINCLENLRPLSASENCSKSDTYNKEEFDKWLKKKQLKTKE